MPLHPPLVIPTQFVALRESSSPAALPFPVTKIPTSCLQTPIPLVAAVLCRHLGFRGTGIPGCAFGFLFPEPPNCKLPVTNFFPEVSP